MKVAVVTMHVKQGKCEENVDWGFCSVAPVMIEVVSQQCRT